MECEKSRCWDCAWRRITGPGNDPTLCCDHVSDSVRKLYRGGTSIEACKEYVKDDPKIKVSVIRDTRETFMRAIHQMAVNSGNFAKAEAIVDYFLPYTLGVPEQITCDDFLFTTKVNFGGSEGIHLTCYAAGRIADDGKKGLWPLGTYKTLRTSLTAMQTFGELGGTLTYFARRYLQENSMRFLTDRALRVSAIRETHRR